MSPRIFLFLLCHNKWIIFLPIMIVPIIACFILINTEPIYFSSCKIWTKEKNEESGFLDIKRMGSQNNSYIEVQKEIITSTPVIASVIDELGLIKPPASQTIFSRITGMSETKQNPISEEESKINAIKAIKNSLEVQIINSEIFVITVKMNSPQLAQKTLQSVINSFRKHYLDILNNEIDAYKLFLGNELSKLDEIVTEKELDLNTFEQSHPEIPAFGHDRDSADRQPISFVKKIDDMNPISGMLKTLAELEMKRNLLATELQPDSHEIVSLDRSIMLNTKLIDGYKDTLRIQSKNALDHEHLRWKLSLARSQFNYINSEYHKILIAQGTKVKQTSSITILEHPNLNSIKIAPKKKSLLLAAIFFGLLIGLGCTYLRFLLDRTIHLSEQLSSLTGLPVICSIKKRSDTKDGHEST
ncbi:MAG: hypothetical protein HRU15_20700 [Planctomycetes bacterium]|nr:hypothetical protein [Planctomycetota bacterium]